MSGVSGVTRASLSMARTVAAAAVCCAKLRGGGGTLAALASLVALVALLLGALPAGAQSATTLVVNTGQTVAGGANLLFVGPDSGDDFRIALTFQTGDNALGYTLSEVDLRFRSNTNNQNADVKASIFSTTSEREPSSRLYTLTNPATAVANAIGTLTAPANASLSANTAYALVLESTSTKNPEFSVTYSDNEDAASASGWSIDNTVHESNNQGAWSDITDSAIPLIAVKGAARTTAATTAAPANPDPSNLARGAVQWDPVGAMHGLPARIGEISSNKPSEPTGSVDLTNIAASVSEEREPHSRGYYLTTQVFGLGDQSHLVRAGPNGSRYIVDEDGQRYEVVSPGSLLLIKIWHVHYRPDRGTNSVELLGDTFLPRRDNRLTEPVEICLPAPGRDKERVRIAVKGRLDPHWTILDAELRDGQVCAETVRVAWLVLVKEREDEAA